MSESSPTTARNDEPIVLEEATVPLPDPEADRRPTLPEPPPVWLVAVEDVRLPTIGGLEAKLTAFYRDLLKFEIDEIEPLVYRAENCRLRFEMFEMPIERIDFRATMIEVPDLLEFEKELIDRKIEYERIKGLAPGERSILLQDPAGNIVQVSERRELA